MVCVCMCVCGGGRGASVVVVVGCCKRVTLHPQGTGRPGRPMYLNLRSFIADAMHNKLLAVPALFYAINNSLKFSMQVCACVCVRTWTWGWMGSWGHRFLREGTAWSGSLTEKWLAPGCGWQGAHTRTHTSLHMCICVVQLFFHPTTTKMLGNLKIFTIALLMRMIMKRRFNVIQVREL